MSALILHTFGILKHAAGHPASQAFMPDGTCMSKETEFGIPPTPTFFEKDIDRYGLATLSAWTDIESAVGFSFHRAHGDAMKHRKDWFQQDHSCRRPSCGGWTILLQWIGPRRIRDWSN